MQPLVLGTAGHIDHGKTALVRALTGVDTDRLPEEKSRGITIELGFAALDLEDGLRLGVVDVPGHEKLVRTMVAGASGIDLVLLVVAADEGVMPQTREHVAICELLGIEHGVVALTKADLADETMIELAREEIRELLAETALARAPVVTTSAATGAGLTELRETLGAVARAARARTTRAGPPRLPVDRVFAMRGFGAVVTGTLIGAPFRVGDAVMLYPSGLRSRVRGLQRHGSPQERVEPGARCAVNLQGLEVADVRRGQVLSLPDRLAPTRVLDARVRWIAGAPPVEDAAAVELIVGTAERRARLALLGAARLEPGETGFARLHVEGEPLAVLPGDRFVIRGFARTEQGGTTLGGGVILDVAPPRRRRGDASVVRDLARLAALDPRDAVRIRVERAGLAGIARDRLLIETGLAEPRLDALLEDLRGEEVARVTRAGTWLSSAALGALSARLTEALEAFHARERLRPGMPTGALRGTLPPSVRPDAFELALEREREAGRIVVDEDVVRVAIHRVALGEAERALARRIAERARTAGLEPPTLKEWAEELGEPEARLRELLAHLEREGTVVSASGGLWFDADAVRALRERVVATLEAEGGLETPAYKTLIGTTRKHAVPLMELFDRERLTLRVGNRRVLRGRERSGSSA